MGDSQSDLGTVQASRNIPGSNMEVESSQSSTPTIRELEMAHSDSDEAEISGLPTNISHDPFTCMGFGATHSNVYTDPKSSMYSIAAFVVSGSAAEKQVLPVEVPGALYDDEGYEADEEFESNGLEHGLDVSVANNSLEMTQGINNK